MQGPFQNATMPITIYFANALHVEHSAGRELGVFLSHIIVEQVTPHSDLDFSFGYFRQ